MSDLALPKSPLHPTEKDFSAGIKWSLIAHLAALILIILQGLVFPGTPKPYFSTLRVDVVGLPDLLKTELSKVPSSTQDMGKIQESLKKAEKELKQKPSITKKEVERADPDEMVLKPKVPKDSSHDRERKLRSALDRIKALSKITDAETPKPAAPLIKGNMISKGTSLSGEAREAAQASYYDAIKERLQDNWALPVWIARQKLSAQIQIFIDARGRLTSYRVVRPSGNVQFDDAVKRTLTDSQPFAVPPEELRRSLLTDGILIGFPL